jgi:TrpR family transcriptional regulator, trp operon repressor
MRSKGGKDGWWRFLKLCQSCKTERQRSDFFDFFLTLEEKAAIGLRCSVFKELLEGDKTQRDIAGDLQTSIAKVTRGSNNLKTVSKDLRKFLVKHLA